MREHPILFSSEMVKAILDGRKTMTRFVHAVEPLNAIEAVFAFRVVKPPNPWDSCDEGIDIQVSLQNKGFSCPYGIPGDRLWVRETLTCNEFGWAFYEADGQQVLIGGPGINDGVAWEWKKQRLPSIFMPRWASRITLEITNVRVERLQEIPLQDTFREGWPGLPAANCLSEKWFEDLWDSINGKKYPWDSNPWVWVISFKLAEE